MDIIYLISFNLDLNDIFYGFLGFYYILFLQIILIDFEILHSVFI